MPGSVTEASRPARARGFSVLSAFSPGPVAMTLFESNSTAHRRQLELVEGFLEAVTALDLAAASAMLDRFRADLGAHMEVEESAVLPAALGLDIDPVLLRQIDGDHRLLERCLGKVGTVLGTLAREPAPRRALVRSLGALNRLLELVEHHTLREEALYRALDRALEATVRDRLASRLGGDQAE